MVQLSERTCGMWMLLMSRCVRVYCHDRRLLRAGTSYRRVVAISGIADWSITEQAVGQVGYNNVTCDVVA